MFEFLSYKLCSWFLYSSALHCVSLSHQSSSEQASLSDENWPALSEVTEVTSPTLMKPKPAGGMKIVPPPTTASVAAVVSAAPGVVSGAAPVSSPVVSSSSHNQSNSDSGGDDSSKENKENNSSNDEGNKTPKRRGECDQHIYWTNKFEC